MSSSMAEAEHGSYVVAPTSTATTTLERSEEAKELPDARPDTPATRDDKDAGPNDLERWNTRPNMSYPMEYLFVTLMACAQLFTQAGLGMNVAPLYYIGDSFNETNPGQLSWTVAAYSLTVGTFILPAGRLGEIFGYKPVFLAGTMWYALWSLIAGVSYYSGTIIFFDFCRAMQGIGPSIMLPNAIAILGVTYPPGKRKELIFGIFGATAPSGFNIGAVFASLFAQEVYWPWGYYLMAIACLLLAGLSFWVVPNTPNIAAKTGPFNVMRMDPLGMFVGVTGLVLINFSWNQGPVAGWTTPYVYAILIVGFVFMAAFFYLELRVSEFPLVPLKKISGKSGFVLGCIAAGWGSFGIWVFYLWNFCLELRKQTPILTAAQVVPTSVSGLVAAVTTGLILSKVRPSIIMLIAMLAFTVGAVLLATMPVEQTYWAQMFVACIVTPWGMDMSFPSGTIIMSNSMPREEQGTAASLVNTVLNYSISIGLGMAGTIERYVVPVEDSDAARLRAYRAVWYLGIGLAGLGVCVASAFVVQDHAASKREAELKPEKSSSQEKEAA